MPTSLVIYKQIDHFRLILQCAIKCTFNMTHSGLPFSRATLVLKKLKNFYVDLFLMYVLQYYSHYVHLIWAPEACLSVNSSSLHTCFNLVHKFFRMQPFGIHHVIPLPVMTCTTLSLPKSHQIWEQKANMWWEAR